MLVNNCRSSWNHFYQAMYTSVEWNVDNGGAGPFARGMKKATTRGNLPTRNYYLLFSNPNANKSGCWWSTAADICFHLVGSGFNGPPSSTFSQFGRQSHGLLIESQTHSHLSIIVMKIIWSPGSIAALSSIDRATTLKAHLMADRLHSST